MTHRHTRPYGPKRHREGQPDLRGLDELHRRLVKAACAGEVAHFSTNDVLNAELLAALITGHGYHGRVPWALTPRGVRIKGGRIDTRLDLSYSQIEVPLGFFRMELRRGVNLASARTRELFFDSCKIKSIYLTNSIIDGQLNINNSTVNYPKSIAINAQNVKISNGFFIKKSIINGILDINACEIGYQLNADDSKFYNPNKKAIWAQGAKIFDAVFLNKVTINGICDFNSSEVAEIFLRRSYIIGTFRGDFGAKINYLDLSSTTLISDRSVKNSSDQSSETSTTSSIALNLTDARIGRLDMPKKAQHQINGVVKMTRCHVEHFCDHKSAWPEALERMEGRWITPPSRLDPKTGEDIRYYDLNGFTYDYLAAPNGGSADGAEESTAQARKRWLLSQHAHDIADHFKPQPWRQMAARLEAQGHDDAARKIAEHRRRFHRYSKSTRGFDIFMSWVLDITSHYGFDPWLTLRRSSYVIAAFALLYGLAAATGPMPGGGYQPLPMIAPALIGPASDANANPPPVFIRAQADDVTAATNISDLAQADPFLSRVYPDFNPLLYSLDVFVPVLDLGMEAYWRPNPNHLRPGFSGSSWMVGSILYWLTILQRFVGAILIAIMVTSFTGLLTREDKLS